MINLMSLVWVKILHFLVDDDYQGSHLKQRTYPKSSECDVARELYVRIHCPPLNHSEKAAGMEIKPFRHDQPHKQKLPETIQGRRKLPLGGI